MLIALLYCPPLLLLPGCWTVDGLSAALEAQPSVTRRHLGFWVGQGVLREHPTDTFTVVERLQEGAAARSGGGGEGEDEDESVMASLEEQKESELQVSCCGVVRSSEPSDSRLQSLRGAPFGSQKPSPPVEHECCLVVAVHLDTFVCYRCSGRTS